jgi:ribosome-associated protein
MTNPLITIPPRAKKPAQSSGSDGPLVSYPDLCRRAAQIADAKKATNIVILDVGDLVGITDLFIIASGSNRRLVLLVAEEIEAAVKAAGGPSPLSVEGLEEANWVLIDFGPFIVHVFQDETRAFYDLDRLWKDAPIVAWEPLPAGIEHDNDD